MERSYRYVSGGSSIGEPHDPGVAFIAPAPDVIVQPDMVEDERRAAPEQVEYGEFRDEWDAAMSDVSDD